MYEATVWLDDNFMLMKFCSRDIFSPMSDEMPFDLKCFQAVVVWAIGAFCLYF